MISRILGKALKSLGASSLADWSEQYPTAGMVELARKLPVSVAPIALIHAMAEETHARGDFEVFARAWLVRVLNDTKDSATWQHIFDDAQRPSANKLWRKVETELKAHPQWVPEHKNDPRVVAMFEGVDLQRSARSQRTARAFERIDAICRRTTTNKEVLEELAQLPAGYGYLHAVRWVNNEVSNGGFEQVYRNGAGVEVPLAIAGFRSLHRDDLATLVRESLGYGRVAHPTLVDGSIEEVPAMPTARTWAQLDEAYAALPRDGLVESYSKLLESRPELFELPFRELKHASDGRRWKVRTNGSSVEIHITLEDGTCVTRERKQPSSSSAQLEMQHLVEEQLREGFVVV